MGVRIGGVVAAVVVLLGSFLPWLSVSGFGMTETYGGVASELGEDPLTLIGAGKLTLLPAIAIGVLFGLWKRGTVIAAAAVSLLVVVVGIYDMINIKVAFGGDDYSGIDASPSFGLYLVVLGGLAGIALGVIGRASIKSAPAGVAAPYGVGQAPAWGQAPAQYAQTVQPVQQQPVQAQPVQAQPVQQQPVQAQPVQQQPAQAAAVPAGWHPDPYGQAQLRYWNGATWTEHTHNQ